MSLKILCMEWVEKRDSFYWVGGEKIVFMVGEMTNGNEGEMGEEQNWDFCDGSGSARTCTTQGML